ncbi:Pyruvate dehydrogenase E1 component [compost metagenome]
MIAEYVQAPYVTLGTDGFGRSDTRQQLRRFFEVDRFSIVLASLHSLVRQGGIERGVLDQALERYGHRDADAPWHS